jgi:hypothetical protein
VARRCLISGAANFGTGLSDSLEGEPSPKIQPTRQPILLDGARLDVQERQHAQRGDDLKHHSGDAMRLSHQLRQRQLGVLILRGHDTTQHVV